MIDHQSLREYATSVEPGAGAVARWDGGLAVAGGDDRRAFELMTAWRAAIGDAPETGEVVGLLRSDPRFSTGAVDLVVVVGTSEGVRVFVRGRTEIRTESDELITGPEPVERELVAPMALWVGLGGPPLTQAHPVFDLRLGVVPGRGVVVYRLPDRAPPDRGGATEAAVSSGPDATIPGQGAGPGLPEQASPPVSPSAPPAPPGQPGVARADGAALPSAPFEPVDWGGPVESRSPLPVATGEAADVGALSSSDQVMGIRCSRDHFNNPDAGYCQVCGISMVNLTRRLVPGPRPTLGFVVFADGATYAVDRPYLIGRSPRPSTRSGLTGLATQDQTHSVSREHAELRPDGWDVLYTDLSSTNGSFIWEPLAQTWTPLRPREPLRVTSGTTISVGRMTFVFQGASKEVEIR